MADKYRRWNDWAPRYIADLMRDFGLTAEQAAAFPGNFAAESGYFNSLQELHPLVSGSAGGLGHAQWTGARRRTFEQWLARKGLKVDSYEGNYSMLFRELSGPFRGNVLDRVKKSKSLEDAVYIVGKYYEGPAVLNLAPRVKGAKEALALYRKTPAKPTAWLPEKEETPVVVTPAVAVNTARAAIPWFKSLVFMGGTGALGTSFAALVNAYQPGVPLKDQLGTLAPLAGAVLSAAAVVLGRVTSTAQPLTTSQEAADKHTEAREAAVPVAEAWDDPSAVPAGAVPMTQLSLDQLAHEMPEVAEKVLGLVTAISPMLGIVSKLAEASKAASNARQPKA